MTWDQITWDQLGEPAVLGLFVAVLMVLVFKPLVVAVVTAIYHSKHGGQDPPADWKPLSLVVNATTLLLSAIVAVIRLREGEPGEILTLAVLGTAFATVEYEAVKNTLGAFGVNLKGVGLIGTDVGVHRE